MDPVPKTTIGPANCLVTLPVELTQAVLREMLPYHSITAYESTSDQPQVARSYVLSRSGLASVCQVSRRMHSLAIPFLYHTILLKSHRELFYFFRTMAEVPSYREFARVLIWTAMLSKRDFVFMEMIDLSTTTLRSETKDVDTSILWHPKGQTEALVGILGSMLALGSPKECPVSHILAAALSVLPEIKVLFLSLHTGNSIGPLPHPPVVIEMTPEHDAISRLFGTSKCIETNPLDQVKKLILEAFPYSNKASASFAIDTVLHILQDSPRLRHVMLKSDTIFNGLVKGGTRHGPLPPTILKHTRTLHHIGGGYPQSGMENLAIAFPNLVALHYESKVGAFPKPRGRGYTGFLNCLTSLSATLETFSLTTLAGVSWNRTDTPAVLSPALRHMKRLRCLRIETIWLFGTLDFSAAHYVADLLPASLVDLHLIDYWGSYEPDTLWPQFPERMTPFNFIDTVLTGLLHGCRTSLTELKSLAVTSPIFCRPHYRECQVDEDITLLENRFCSLFESTGVAFSIVRQDDLGDIMHSSWGRPGVV
ncbi:hypothetical protein GGR57DRAFT_462574 [Xylariaceae sp. FL1272]|nr:hypothetical protein GGR57DRAFT_462574 [Xylariaceae sp. FL1272]